MSDDLKKYILHRDKRILKRINLLQELMCNTEIYYILELEIERIQSLHSDINILNNWILELVISNINSREKIEIEEELSQLERQIFEEEYSHYFIVDESNE